MSWNKFVNNNILSTISIDTRIVATDKFSLFDTSAHIDDNYP